MILQHSNSFQWLDHWGIESNDGRFWRINRKVTGLISLLKGSQNVSKRFLSFSQGWTQRILAFDVRKNGLGRQGGEISRICSLFFLVFLRFFSPLVYPPLFPPLCFIGFSCADLSFSIRLLFSDNTSGAITFTSCYSPSNFRPGVWLILAKILSRVLGEGESHTYAKQIILVSFLRFFCFVRKFGM